MASSSNRGYPWATGQIVAKSPGSENNNIRIFNAKGFSSPGVLGTTPLPMIGVPIPGTFLVYIRPRLNQDPLGGSGGSQYAAARWPGGGAPPAARMSMPGKSPITITNPEYSMYRERRRTPSIGMGGALSMGATMDVPFQSNAGWFSPSVT
jgi:hypothetical protein